MEENNKINMPTLAAAIAYTNSHGGGGGGGTSNYNDLSNKPQIGGTTLTGNKSASDLSLATTADLARKVDKAEGYGLSENNYTDADKASVATIAGKQNALTAGKYINIDANNEISVDREIQDEAFTYTIQQTGDGIVKITKTVDGAVVFEETYNGDADVTLDALHYVYNAGVQSYTLLIASDTHEAGFKQVMSWWQRVTYTENFSTVDHSGEKLIIKSEMDSAIDAAVSSAYHHAGTKTCVELVAGLLVAGNEGNVYNMTDSGTTTSDFIEGAGQPIKAGDNVGVCKVSDGVYKFDLLSGFVDTSNFVQKSVTAGLIKNDGTIDTVEKQPKTDNNLTTTSKDTTGAINELRSGLTNYQTQNDLNLEVPNRKNVLTYPYIGKSSTSFGVTFDQTPEHITLDGEATQGFNKVLIGKSASTWAVLSNAVPLVPIDGKYTFSGMTDHVPLQVRLYRDGSLYSDRILTEPYTYTLKSTDLFEISIKITNGAVYDDTVDIITPMLEYGDTATTFEQYIPSVDKRIDALENVIPDAPTSNGTYTLKATVSSVGVAYSWVADT